MPTFHSLHFQSVLRMLFPEYVGPFAPFTLVAPKCREGRGFKNRARPQASCVCEELGLGIPLWFTEHLTVGNMKQWIKPGFTLLIHGLRYQDDY